MFHCAERLDADYANKKASRASTARLQLSLLVRAPVSFQGPLGDARLASSSLLTHTSPGDRRIEPRPCRSAHCSSAYA